MICSPCGQGSHILCATPSCPCGHRGSPVQPLSADERHQFMICVRDEYLTVPDTSARW